jgi:NAD(P)H-flavin reductase
MIHDQLAKKTPKHLYLIYGHRYEADILYRREWEAVAKEHSNFQYLFTLSRDTGWTGEKGYVQEKIEKFVPAVKEKNYFICGLNNMITAVNDKLLSLGVPKEQIHFERYD